MQNSISNKIIQKWIEILPKNVIDASFIKSLAVLNTKGNLGNEKELISAIENLEGHYDKDKNTNS